MWDVKQVAGVKILKSNNSFTLTMWDVKLFARNACFDIANGFTLTMWDVKIFYGDFHDEHGGFYLNYVGCKVVGVAGWLVFYYRFTLTMWDVKSNFADVVRGLVLCFTLTMWDVKVL